MEILKIKNILGQEILSRNNVRKLKTLINKDNIELDFHEVSFISRSAADEVENILNNHPDIKLLNLSSDVAEIFSIVKAGRASNNRVHSRIKRSITYVCDSMEDVRKALLSLV